MIDVVLHRYVIGNTLAGDSPSSMNKISMEGFENLKIIHLHFYFLKLIIRHHVYLAITEKYVLYQSHLHRDRCSAVSKYQRNNELEVTSAFSQKSKGNHLLESIRSRRSQGNNEMAEVPVLIQKLSSEVVLGQAN